LKKLHINLSDEEVKLLVAEFDPSGDANMLDINLFVEEYDAWHQDDQGLSGLK
jgi:Ca2+-binding EF-hand superfamily protein